MSANIQTILIIGATSGLGEQFARRFHALGKKIVATGRRADRLDALKAELGSNIETYPWDILDLANLTKHATKILTQHPDIDTVFQVAGVMDSFSYLDPASSTEELNIAEINTNFTARFILARTFIPYLQTKAKSGTASTYMLMSSGLAFIPVGHFPIYDATQAATHSLAVCLRQQINGQPDDSVKKNFHVIEIVAPYVATDLAKDFRDRVPLPPPMDPTDFIDNAMDGMAKSDTEGKPLKEIAVGFAAVGVGLWRDSIGKQLEKMGMAC